jgi:hypothetical protein
MEELAQDQEITGFNATLNILVSSLINHHTCKGGIPLRELRQISMLE